MAAVDYDHPAIKNGRLIIVLTNGRHYEVGIRKATEELKKLRAEETVRPLGLFNVQRLVVLMMAVELWNFFKSGAYDNGKGPK